MLVINYKTVQLITWNDVCLNDFHHWSFKLKFSFATSCGPRMLIHFFQLKKKKQDRFNTQISN